LKNKVYGFIKNFVADLYKSQNRIYYSMICSLVIFVAHAIFHFYFVVGLFFN